MVALWPKNRGPLVDGQIVRLEDGSLGEWFPLPASWAPLDNLPCPFFGLAPLRFHNGPDQPWALWPKPDHPSLTELLSRASSPKIRPGWLRALARLAQNEGNIPNPGKLCLDPDCLLFPGGDPNEPATKLLVFWVPLAGPPKDPQEREKDLARVWVSFFQKLGTVLGPRDGEFFQALAQRFTENPVDNPATMARELEDKANLLENAERKRRNGVLTTVLLALASAGMAIGLLACLGAIMTQRKREKDLNRTVARLDKRAEEQANLLTGQAERDIWALAGPHTRLSLAEQNRWRAWIRIASTFDRGDASQPHLLFLRAQVHDWLGETLIATQLLTRIAGEDSVWAVRASLLLAQRNPEVEPGADDWIQRAEALLEGFAPSSELDCFSAEIDIIRASRFLQQAQVENKENHEESDRLFEEARSKLEEILQASLHSELHPIKARALSLYSGLPAVQNNPSLWGDCEAKLAQAIVDLPGVYLLYRDRIRFLARILEDASNRSQAQKTGASLQALILEAWRVFPARREQLLFEIRCLLHCAMVQDDGAEGAFPGSTSAELWAMALAKLESHHAEKPGDPAILREFARVWLVGANLADRAPVGIPGTNTVYGDKGLAPVMERYGRALFFWEKLIRLEGKDPDLVLVTARTRQELGWAAQRAGDTVLALDQRKLARELAQSVWKDYPGSIDALEILIRLEETQIWEAVLRGEPSAGKPNLESLNRLVLGFRPGQDRDDRDRFQWVLMRRALAEVLLGLSSAEKPDDKSIGKWCAEIAATLEGGPGKWPGKSLDYLEEMDRLKARLAAIEYRRLVRSGASRDKAETQLSRARQLANKAIWSPWEKKQFDALWLGLK